MGPTIVSAPCSAASASLAPACAAFSAVIVFARPWRTWTSDAVVYVVLPIVNDPFGKCFCDRFRSDRSCFLRENGGGVPWRTAELEPLGRLTMSQGTVRVTVHLRPEEGLSWDEGLTDRARSINAAISPSSTAKESFAVRPCGAEARSPARRADSAPALRLSAYRRRRLEDVAYAATRTRVPTMWFIAAWSAAGIAPV